MIKGKGGLPAGQKQPSILWSSQSELVSESVQVAIHGEPLSSYTMFKGHVLAIREINVVLYVCIQNKLNDSSTFASGK